MAVLDPITVFYNALGRYPGNNKQWWLARADVDDDTAGIKTGDFLPKILDKLFSGNMRAPRGHYILSAFNKDRSYSSGITGLTPETIDERPSTVAFFSGRAWYACRSTVYFSQILTDKHKAAWCYQEADPTSEQISEPVATDGGVIPIPEASNIIKLLPHGGGMLVFALNGVWYITGTQAGFSALDISVNKVSPIGCRSPLSVVATETGVFWWSDVGIMGMEQSNGTFGPFASGGFQKTNLAEETIQSLYNEIPNDVRSEVKATYDPKANTILWMYRDEDVAVTQYNRVLILDLTLQAFYPWKFGDISSGPKIKGFYVAERTNTYTNGDTDIAPSQIEYISLDGTELRINQVRNGNFSDWQSVDGVGVAYESFMESGYELFDDAMRDKNITYVFSYFRRTEDVYDEVEGLDDPSSCYLTVKWDWADGTHSNKWTTPVQVYRPGRINFDPDTGFGLVVTKSKVRGNGKAIQFRYGTDEIGKNFDLHGWAISVTGNINP